MIRALSLAGLMVLATILPAGAVTVHKVTSPGGIEAWLVEDHGNPIIAIDTAFVGGSSVETKPGLANMTAALLDEGAGPLESQSFQARLEDLSIHMTFAAGRDRFGASMQTLTDNRDQAFDLLRLALTQPRFDAKAVERIRGQITAGLIRESQSPNAMAAKAWSRAAFGDHPYGRPGKGDPQTVKSITRAELKAYAHTWLSRRDLAIGVVGDITPQQLAPLLDKTFGALAATHPAVSVPDIRVGGAGKTLVIDREMPQSVALFGAPGIKRDDPDWYPAYVMNYILGGGGFSSRLTEEVREKRGLAYGVSTSLAPMEHSAILQGSVATQNARIAQSLELIRAELARMAEAGPTDQEMANAKTYLTGSFPLGQDSVSSIASLLVAMQTQDLGIDYLDRRNALIEAVTTDQVRAAAKRLLDPASLLVVVVGKPQGITATP